MRHPSFSDPLNGDDPDQRRKWSEVVSDHDSFPTIGAGYSLRLEAFIATAHCAPKALNESAARVTHSPSICDTSARAFAAASLDFPPVGLHVVVAHGAGGGYDQGLDIAAPLLERNAFRVVAVSRFGYLRSPLPQDASAADRRRDRGIPVCAFR